MASSPRPVLRYHAPAARARIASAAALLPVRGLGGKHRVATDDLRRAVQRIQGVAENGEVWRAAVRLERGGVAIHLVEVVDVRILLVAQHIEAQAPRLILLGAERIRFDRLEETLAFRRLDTDLHPECKHGTSFLIVPVPGSRRRPGRRSSLPPRTPWHHPPMTGGERTATRHPADCRRSPARCRRPIAR